MILKVVDFKVFESEFECEDVAVSLWAGTLGGIWNNRRRLEDAYLAKYPGYYCTGDTGFRDDAGCINVMSRVDDLINVAGHRLSTATMEQARSLFVECCHF